MPTSLNAVYQRSLRLDQDPQFLPYFEQETTELPRYYYFDLVRKDLGLLWEWLPEGALDHDPNTYSKTEPESTRAPRALRTVVGIESEGRKNQLGDS